MFYLFQLEFIAYLFDNKHTNINETFSCRFKLFTVNIYTYLPITYIAISLFCMNNDFAFMILSELYVYRDRTKNKEMLKAHSGASTIAF